MGGSGIGSAAGMGGVGQAGGPQGRGGQQPQQPGAAGGGFYGAGRFAGQVQGAQGGQNTHQQHQGPAAHHQMGYQHQQGASDGGSPFYGYQPRAGYWQ